MQLSGPSNPPPTMGRPLPRPDHSSRASPPSPDKRRPTLDSTDIGTLSDTTSQYLWKPQQDARVSSKPIPDFEDDLDIAPVDQPPEIQALQDREPFAVLARHLSGVSAVSKHSAAAESGNAPQPFDPPPDGGIEAWSVVMGAWFVLFVEFGISTYSNASMAEY
jgi:hypothetical protein